MNEELYLDRRWEWQNRYNRRRLLVLCLELFASSCWIAYGMERFNQLDIVLSILYALMLLVLFLPGLLYVLFDFLKTRQMSVVERFSLITNEPEDEEFTRVIVKSCIFLLVFFAIVIVPAFFLLDAFDAYLWTLFMTSIVTLSIATLVGALWKLNTSYIDEVGDSSSRE